MRTLKLIGHEIEFCAKYGIVFMYIVFTLFYVIALSAIPGEAKTLTGTVLIFTDPAAMGLFFMGAIILLEKSQRVNCSLAVSPVGVVSYIWAKILALIVMGLAVGLCISFAAGNGNLLLSAVAIALSSAIFSLWGLVIAQKTESLNAFMIETIPCEIVICVPALLYLFEVLKGPLWMLHPGVSAIKLINGNTEQWYLCMFSLSFWTTVSYEICYTSTKAYFKKMGGGKL